MLGPNTVHPNLNRGEDFRQEFSHLGGIRNIIPESVHVMTLIATANLSTQKIQAPAVIYVPPLRNNITYFVGDKPKGGIGGVFQPIVEKLKLERNMGRIIMFCRHTPV